MNSSNISLNHNRFNPSTIAKNKVKALIILSFFHIFIITISNYLVQIPFSINIFGFEIHNTLGSFSFPFIFLATDLTVRIFGAKEAKYIIFWVMFPALLVSYVVSILATDGVAGLQTFNLFVFRIACASFFAYLCGQLLDVTVFNNLRRLKWWWIAPSSSTIFGSLMDTIVFFFVAFYHSQDLYMAEHWFEIALVDYSVKLAISLLFFVPAYGVLLNYITKKLAN